MSREKSGGRGGEEAIGRVEAHNVLSRRGGLGGQVEESFSVLSRAHSIWFGSRPGGSRGRGGGSIFAMNTWCAARSRQLDRY